MRHLCNPPTLPFINKPGYRHSSNILGGKENRSTDGFGMRFRGLDGFNRGDKLPELALTLWRGQARRQRFSVECEGDGLRGLNRLPGRLGDPFHEPGEFVSVS